MKLLSIYLISVLFLTSACITDEPPSLRDEMVGTWVLASLQGNTYEEIPDSSTFTYEKKNIHSEELRVNGEEFTFMNSGMYRVAYREETRRNESQAFVFTAGNVNEPISEGLNIFMVGIWEEYINSNGENIIHFDQQLATEDVFMIAEKADMDSLVLVLNLNNFNTQNGRKIVIPTAEYHGSREGFFVANLAPDSYDIGFQFGSKLGLYLGFQEAYRKDDNNFIYIYGIPYALFFQQEINKMQREAPQLMAGYSAGLRNGRDEGKILAETHTNEFTKGFKLTYRFVRK